MKTPPALQALQTHWSQLAPREQALVRMAAAVVLLALLWGLLLAPPLKVLRQSDARHAELDARWQQMQQLQTEAEQLQSAPRHAGSDAPAQLQAAVQAQLGAAAKLNIAAGRATLTLTEVPAEALAAWLAQVRTSAQAAPVQADLTRAQGAAPVRWSGTLVLALPTP